jgi:uncharacterized protein (DUF58 family)
VIRPTARCLALFAAGLPLALLPSLLTPRLWAAWAAFLAAALLLAGVDALLVRRPRELASDVEAPGRLYIGDEGTARVVLRLAGAGRGVDAEALLDVGPDLAPLPPASLPVPAGGSAEASFPVLPRRRGTHRIERLWLRWRGPLGLVRVQSVRELGLEVAVVPNAAAVRAAALRIFGLQGSRAGMKVEQYLGDGSEFESLREFVPGFDPRAMNWKATARHRRLLVQQYRAERDNQVVVAFDTGRLMAEPLGGIPRLDHAVTAGLLLAYFGVRTGDRVGMFAFDSRVRLFVPPAAGLAAYRRIQARSAELEYSTEEPNFTLGITGLLTRLTRRSLVVVFTDFADSVSAELMADNLDRAARRHLVLFAALRDPELEAAAGAVPSDLDALHRAVVAGDLVRDRLRVLRRLRLAGVRCLDAPPGRAAASLVQHYLEIRRRELV